MFVSHRPTRLLAAVLLAALLCIFWQYSDLSQNYTTWIPSRLLPAGYSPSRPGDPSDEKPYISDIISDEKNPIPIEYDPDGDGDRNDVEVEIEVEPDDGLDKNIHRFLTADSFLDHFKAVTELPGITLEKAKAGCPWPKDAIVDFQFDSTKDWWAQDRPDSEIEDRRKEWHEYVLTGMKPYSEYESRFHGRGLVIVAGHEKSMKRLRVLINALKKIGSTMPIEVHYWDDELSPDRRAEFDHLWPDIFFNDLSSNSNIIETTKNSPWINYQLKTAAMVNSRFAEPLLLDSDNIPVLDPALLYESDVYKEYGTLFWPDIARTHPSNPMWSITNTICRMNEYEQESGQMLVDKRKFFYHLQLAAWFNGKDPEYYNSFLLGDKDMFRFTWHALKTKYGFPPRWLTSVGTLTDGYYCGHTFAQHNPEGEIAFLHGGLVKTITPEAMKFHKDSQGGIYNYYKRSAYDEQHGVNVNVGIKWTNTPWVKDKKEGTFPQSCADIYDEEPRPFGELIPGWEATFREIGGYWLIGE